MKKTILAIVLVFSMLLPLAIPAFAASGEDFLSDVALVYEDSKEDALEAIKGTDWKLFDRNLNPKADALFHDGVYLIYKTSKNVEDAITDLRVMDMYGGFSTSNYERQLAESRQEYLETVEKVRIAAAEFKARYIAGDGMAKLAYRQMNFYKDVKTENGNESNMLMGDFFLNIPSDNALVQVMMEGNYYVFSNLMSLLAVGISGDDTKTLASEVERYYLIKDTLSPELYHDRAVTLTKYFEQILPKIMRYDALSENYDPTKEEFTEEEFLFMSTYTSLVLLLEGIKLGNETLDDVIRKNEWTSRDLYPLAAALTDGQMALVELGQLETVLKYNAPSKALSELNKLVDDAENSLLNEDGTFTPLNVYTGVDRSIFKGAFAMTNAAERQQALTGKTWDITDARTPSTGFLVGFIVAGAVDLALVGFTTGVLIKYASLRSALLAALKADLHGMTLNGVSYHAYVYECKTFSAKWMPAAKFSYYGSIGLTLMILGVYGITTWYNYYNPRYTEIPNVMVDVRETDLGDRYIKYDAAKVFGEEHKNADFNAYEGKEWIALYYTKDASAGNCLTPNFMYRENNATVSRRYQGVSMFGETAAFNLNSHVYNKNAVGVYLSVRYSVTKKAAADLPPVVASVIMQGGIYLLTAGLGAGVGVGSTLLVQHCKKKKCESAPDTPTTKD